MTLWRKHKKKVIIIGVVCVSAIFALIGLLVGPDDMEIYGDYYAVNGSTIIDSVIFEINDDGTWAISANGEVSENGTYQVVNIGTYKSILHLQGTRYFLNDQTESIDKEIEIERIDVAGEDYGLFIIYGYDVFLEYQMKVYD